MHSHAGHDRPQNMAVIRPLMLALAITIAFALIELIGGLISGSLALVSDAGHMFTDALALALALWAGFVSARLANERQTFGLLRVEILVALVNGVVLAAVSLFILMEAFQRLRSSPEVEGGLMLTVAVLGLVANLAGVVILRRGAEENLNVKGAFLHVLGDLLSSVGVIVAALLVFFFDLRWADPVISIVISVIILYGAYRIIMQSIYILLEFVPGHLDLEEVRAEMMKTEGVRDVHDIHVWTLASGIYALSAHVVVEDCLVSSCSNVLREIEGLLKERFRISHTTLQLEPVGIEVKPCFFSVPREGAYEEEEGGPKPQG